MYFMKQFFPRFMYGKYFNTACLILFPWSYNLGVLMKIANRLLTKEWLHHLHFHLPISWMIVFIKVKYRHFPVELKKKNKSNETLTSQVVLLTCYFFEVSSFICFDLISLNDLITISAFRIVLVVLKFVGF